MFFTCVDASHPTFRPNPLYTYSKKLQIYHTIENPTFPLMAIFGYLEFFLLILGFIVLYISKVQTQNRSSIPANWLLVGMLPGFLKNIHRIHEYLTEVLCECGGTFEFKGPWFYDLDILVTSDPANIHHIFSKNFANYPKGPEFRKIFDILGDGILNADFESWEFHRRTTLSVTRHNKFNMLLERIVWEKVETGLIPVLDYFADQGTDVDLQDIFQRFTFDSICKLVLNDDPGSLCIDLPYIPCEKAFDHTMEALLQRHILPERIWKLQKWLKIGKERKLFKAWKAFDEFIYPRVFVEGDHCGDNYNLLKAFKKAYEEKNEHSSAELSDFLRDTTLSLMVAGRDTTSTCLTWLFWLIGANPLTKIKILEDIETKLDLKEKKKWRYFNVEESRKLIYLHAALCESLRLFPPIALEHKVPVRPDILPSGHYLHPNKKVVFSFYSMGRNETIWGEDCSEFKPGRWILASGGIKHEPSFKFPAFNAGPRTCLGKEMSFIQMKMVAATILYRYDIHLSDGHRVLPGDSVVLHAKHGLRVRLSKREVAD